MSAQADDLITSADLASHTADAAFAQRKALGPRPNDATAAAIWDHDNEILRNRTEELLQSATTLRALAVSAALQGAWPQLQKLDTLSQSIADQIAAIQAFSDRLSKIARVIDFVVSITTFFKSPSLDSAEAIVTAYKAI